MNGDPKYSAGYDVGMAAELDYAYLAEYASTKDGTLTAIGASFTEVVARSFPGMLTLSVAGRIRRAEDDAAPVIRIEFSTPGNPDLLSINAALETDEQAVRYDGKVATVFALSGPIVINEPGLCECVIYLDDERVRRLAFEVVAPEG